MEPLGGGVDGVAPGVPPALPSGMLPPVPPMAAPGVAGAPLVAGGLVPALSVLGVAPGLAGAVAEGVPVLPVVPLVVPLVVALGVLLGGAAVLPVALSSFLPQAPKANVATSAASNTECFIGIPLKKMCT
ncbi:MAG: hypothetical protein ACREX0_02900 [Noviherbaspirillum sp.]